LLFWFRVLVALQGDLIHNRIASSAFAKLERMEMKVLLKDKAYYFDEVFGTMLLGAPSTYCTWLADYVHLVKSRDGSDSGS
jgi:hypothetical protein